jgi:hypothetical protein
MIKLWKRWLYCGLLIGLFVSLTAAGASPLQTQDAQIGSYKLLLSYYSLPRAGQDLVMTIEPRDRTQALQFSQARLDPAKDTSANTVGVQITPTQDEQGVYDVHVNPPIRGTWLLHLTVAGPTGTTAGDIPIAVDGPPAIPVWLGWLIGLLPFPLLIGMIWLQVGWRKTKQDRLQQEMLHRPSF